MANGHMLLNKSAVKAYLHRRQPEVRPGFEFDSVAASVYDELNARVRKILDSSLQRHPAIGKKFMQLG